MTFSQSITETLIHYEHEKDAWSVPIKIDSSEILQRHSGCYLKETNPYDTRKSLCIGVFRTVSKK